MRWWLWVGPQPSHHLYPGSCPRVALFAAFLVILLIYGMKKKDEGTYTLEEPNQASITYKKPDKQEEFYA
uniref:Syndecan/Neurexin domain-containing protein n=1 Tax=Capra hircus TaxID=9925 RepID=A0A8C2RZZ3_CAPHI